ncbi:hypothetical protein [Streptomyces mobaraensis]|uniref:Uncharacterized protein n=1 Tax=Streptomyces mobaraensis TaxID=35621 RepID=A0A5N5WB36_STRMB|nr:hypothetical protein [Streptomyces mobaraensis]KAB7847311.1 hypothetical protein FRZ00_11450 [Streptomyces mobaraensis]
MTHSDRALRILRERPDLAALAAWPFSFDVGAAEHVEEVRLASGGPLRPIAGEDSGGTYFLCAGGAVLHADSEGWAGLLAESLDDALEILIGLPGDACCLSSEDDEATLAAGVAEAEEELRETYGPGFDTDRATLLAGLGLRLRPPRELLARTERAERRTEPDFVLLNAVEGCAYRLDESLRAPVREIVLASARVGSAPPHADACGPAVPEDGSPLAWARLARLQGHTELARVALIRLLDDAGPRDDALVAELVGEFEALGDAWQAERARRLLPRVPEGR